MIIKVSRDRVRITVNVPITIGSYQYCGSSMELCRGKRRLMFVVERGNTGMGCESQENANYKKRKEG